MNREITRRLRFSNGDSEQIAALVANHMRFKDVERMRTSTLKRFVRLPQFEEHLELHRMDCLSSNRRLESYEFVRRLLSETPAEQIRPERLISGNDLKEMGYAPGPAFSRILQAVEDAQLEGIVNTPEQAREYAKHVAEKKEPAGVSKTARSK
jgi:poly(A) polymerase